MIQTFGSTKPTVDIDGDIVMQDYHHNSSSPLSKLSNDWKENQNTESASGRTWSTMYRIPEMTSEGSTPHITTQENHSAQTDRLSSPEPLLTRTPLPTFHYEHNLDPRANPFRPSPQPLHRQYQQQVRPMTTLPLQLPFLQHMPDRPTYGRSASVRQPEPTISSRQLPHPDRNLPPLSSVIHPVPNLEAHVAAHFASRVTLMHEAQAAARFYQQLQPLPRRTPITPTRFVGPSTTGMSSLPPLPGIWGSPNQLPYPEYNGHHTDDFSFGPHFSPPPERPIAVPVSRKVKKPEKKLKTVPCTACMEQFETSALVPAPCNCKYCKECLNDLFRSGCASILNFPPSCHGRPLRINVFGELLSPDVLSRYKQVELEFSSQKPLYCALPTCSEFIQEKNIVTGGNYGICNSCSNCTCTLCKMLLTAHKFEGERICPEEPKSLVALRELGHREEWRQCPSCSNMVEKIDGCDHMECPCGVEFCYRCGNFYNEWDECECAGDTNSDDEREDEDDEQLMWPDHRRMMDAFGRPRCNHEDTDVVEGDTCHGCLEQRRENPHIRFVRCVQCSIELCASCYGNITAETSVW